MSRMATATDPITGEYFPLCVDDACGGHATAAYTLRVFHDLAPASPFGSYSPC
jgi:hypothetical protein